MVRTADAWPRLLVADEWPVVARGEASVDGSSVEIVVRRHADGEHVVYGEAGKSPKYYSGFMLERGEDVRLAIGRVAASLAEHAGRAAHIAALRCFAELPAELPTDRPADVTLPLEGARRLLALLDRLNASDIEQLRAAADELRAAIEHVR